MTYLNPQEIAEYLPDTLPNTENDRRHHLRHALEKYDLYDEKQLAGRAFPIACIALEITQRCNLDCTLCYLSDIAEIVKDVPLFELFRRIEMMHEYYGEGTTIQITGGDPTLRSTEDLVTIVEKITSLNMRSALFTNGIKASREMLKSLSDAGLNDIAFHVDTTQELKGYATEMELNTIRLEYMERAINLPLRLLFNTTIHSGNVSEIPALVDFFTSHADKINLASFQMQADTGRGVLRERDDMAINQERVKRLIEEGVGCDLPYDMPQIGHPDCNAYTAALVSGSARTAFYHRPKFLAKLFATLYPDQGGSSRWAEEKFVLPRVFGECVRSPSLLLQAMGYATGSLWKLKSGLLRANKVHRISFFIHNFMDESKLEAERCDTCVFKVATADGPLSMCVHNAKRDAMISKKVPAQKGQPAWDPLEGTAYQFTEQSATALPLKKSKGRERKALMEQRKAKA